MSIGGDRLRLQCLHDLDVMGGTPIPFCAENQVYANFSMPDGLAIIHKDQSLLQQMDFYAGCLIWSTRKLEQEIGEGKWIPVKLHPDKLLQLCRSSQPYDPSALWATIMRELGPEYAGASAWSPEINVATIDSCGW